MDPLNLTPDSIRALFGEEMRTVAVPLQGLEWRASGSGDGSRVLTGYAAVHEQVTTLYDGTYYRLDEKIARGAFTNVLAADPDVHLNLGHDMNRAIARTKVSGIGGLELTSDDHGLKVYARLNANDPDVAALAAKMELGIMDQMSFAFRVKSSGVRYESETDANGKETELRTITEIAELYDVCVCAQGAYPTTEASLRSLLQAMDASGAHVPNREVHEERRSSEVSQPAPGAETPQVDRARLAAQASAQAARTRFRLEKGQSSENA